jgi:hypothetical protein
MKLIEELPDHLINADQIAWYVLNGRTFGDRARPSRLL